MIQAWLGQRSYRRTLEEVRLKPKRDRKQACWLRAGGLENREESEVVVMTTKRLSCESGSQKKRRLQFQRTGAGGAFKIV